MILTLAAAIFVALFFYSLVVIISIFILHFCIPKAILEQYFKPPHFNEFECEFFSGIPYAHIRTVMFLRVIGFPNSGEMRGLTKVYKLAPRWLRIAAKIIVISIIGIFILLIPIMAITFIYMALEP